ncbi:MAG: 50S ribosomal protein L17 [Opitutaceae bacterium]|jgi:large subunit ribosomal protein L17|nr:50S ribosomal protein L17 [Opitutaceae bacterium]
MRHNKHHASLGVTREHRAAMLSNLGASLIKHGRLQTTLAKARALRPFIEKVVTKARKAAAKTEAKDAIHLRRLALRDIRDEAAVKLLFTEKHKEFAGRPGGYTRIYKLGARGTDAAEMALIEFVPADDPGYKKNRKNAAKAKQAAKTGAVEPEARKAAPAPATPATPAAAEASAAPETPAAPAATEAPAGPQAPAPAEGEAKKD